MLQQNHYKLNYILQKKLQTALHIAAKSVQTALRTAIKSINVLNNET